MKYILTLSLLFSISLQAQEFKFKDVSKAELQEKYHPLDSLASAATLFEKGFLNLIYSDSWRYQLEVTKRVKIYDSDGYDYATIKIPYYQGESRSDREDLNQLKAYVYNLEGDKIVDEKIRKRDILDDEVSKLWMKKVYFSKFETWNCHRIFL